MIFLSDRKIIQISGKDAHNFLQGLITVDIHNCRDDNALWAGLLTPQGKYIFDFFLYPNDNTILLDIHHSQIEALITHLTVYKLRYDVSFEIQSDLYLYNDHNKAHCSKENRIFQDPRHQDMGYRIISSEKLSTSTDSLNLYQQKRIALGIADPVTDMQEIGFFWPEINAEKLNGIDYKKGCYVGQEVTARLKHKTDLKKKIISVQLSQNITPPYKVTHNNKDIATIIAVHQTLALAYIRVDLWQKALHNNAIISDDNIIISEIDHTI